MAEDNTGQGQSGDGQGDGQDPAAKPDAKGAVTRTEFEGLEGKVDKVLDLLSGGKAGKDDKDGDPAGKSVAEQVRDGVERLEAERKAAAAKEDDAKRAKDHEDRLKKLEEAPPAEAPTRRQRLQHILYGGDK